MLDVAINGTGFYATRSPDGLQYTRQGIFNADQEGYLVTNTGNFLQGYGVDDEGNIIQGVLTDLQVSNLSLEPRQTSSLTSIFNLDAREEVLAISGTSALTNNGTISQARAGANNGYVAGPIELVDARVTPNLVQDIIIPSQDNLSAEAIAAEFSQVDGISATATTRTKLDVTNIIGLLGSATRPDPTNPAGPQIPNNAALSINGSAIPLTTISNITELAETINAISGVSASVSNSTEIRIFTNDGADIQVGLTNSGTYVGVQGASTPQFTDAGTPVYVGDGDPVTPPDGTDDILSAVVGGEIELRLEEGVDIQDALPLDVGAQIDVGNAFPGGAAATFDIGGNVVVATDTASFIAAVNAIPGGNYSAVTQGGSQVLVTYTPTAPNPVSFDVSLTAGGAGATADVEKAFNGIAASSTILTVGGNAATIDGENNLFDFVSLIQPPFTINSFDPTDQATYNHATSATIYDSLGNAHTMTQYFVKEPINTANPNVSEWSMYVLVDGEHVGDPVVPGGAASEARYTLQFDREGQLVEPPPTIVITNWVPLDDNGDPIAALQPINTANGGANLPLPDPATSSNFVIDIEDSTQFGAAFSIADLAQNGRALGQLSGLEIASDGSIFARYTNNEASLIGQITLTDFNNPQGLIPVGETAWVASFTSGEPITGVPQTGRLGALQSGALEESNVDLPGQLVKLIIAQRNYQANAKTIETADAVTQTILNI